MINMYRPWISGLRFVDFWFMFPSNAHPATGMPDPFHVSLISYAEYRFCRLIIAKCWRLCNPWVSFFVLHGIGLSVPKRNSCFLGSGHILKNSNAVSHLSLRSPHFFTFLWYHKKNPPAASHKKIHFVIYIKKLCNRITFFEFSCDLNKRFFLTNHKFVFRPTFLISRCDTASQFFSTYPFSYSTHKKTQAEPCRRPAW